MDINSDVCRERITNDNYVDYIVQYGGDVDGLLEYYGNDCVLIVDNNIAIVYLDKNDPKGLQIPYSGMPKIYGLMDSSALESTDIIRVRADPALNLYGNNIIVAIIDTGIDYTNPIFRKADGTTRIVGLWDQTLNIDTGNTVLTNYGSEFNEEQINEALLSNNPYDIVPSIDENGHGTFLAGIAAGGIDEENDFSGVAPNADIVVVKLKQAKSVYKYLRVIDEDIEAFQENDIITAISYVNALAISLQKPLSICLGLGSNCGGHNGLGLIDEFIDRIASTRARSISVPTGNEGNARHHYSGEVEANEEYDVVEFNVAENESGFIMELWGNIPNIYSVGFETPRGNIVERLSPRFETTESIDFLLENVIIDVYYRVVESQTGDEVVVIRLRNPTPGLWKLRVYATGSTARTYNIWMPISDFIKANTYFIRPDPNITITSPGNGEGVITLAGYNHYNGSLFIESGRGYTRQGNVKPDIAAPAVDIYGPDTHGGYIRKSGTSIGSSITAGSAALLLEWYRRQGVVAQTGDQIKASLIRGARREPNIKYPNNMWGYGKLDLYNVFKELT